MDAVVLAFGLNSFVARFSSTLDELSNKVWRRFGIIHGDPFQHGLEIIHDENTTGKGDGYIVDIVCVHGPGGHPQKTWTHTSTESKTNWLTDILPRDLREQKQRVRARVMTYGYPNETKLSTGFLGLLPQHSRRLATELADRRGLDLQDRPLIFIAHSLGGLIVKNALVYASCSDIEHDTCLKSIQLSTIGILYFGTPHREGSRLQWSTLLQRAISLNQDVAVTSKPDSGLQQGDLFTLDLDRYKSIEETFPNYAFYEKVKTTVSSSGASIVAVPQELTAPANDVSWWKCYGLQSTHTDLCKFEGLQDKNYGVVSTALHGCLAHYQQSATRPDKSNHRQLREPSSEMDMHKEGEREWDHDEFSPLSWRAESFAFHLDRQNVSAVNRKIAMLEGQVRRVDISNKRFNFHVLQSGRELVELYTEARSIDQAEPLHRRLYLMTKAELDRLEVKYGYRHLRPLRLIAELARLQSAVGEHPKAERLNRRLLVVIQDRYGYNSLQRAFVLNELAHNALSQGDYSEAEELLIRVRQIQLKHYPGGERHPEVLRTTARLAILFDDQGRYLEAQKIYRGVIDYREQSEEFGPYHDDTLKAMENMALSCRLQGSNDDLARAAEWYEKIIDHRKVVLDRCSGVQKFEPDSQARYDEVVRLIDETMQRWIDVVREIGDDDDDERIRDLHAKWLHIRQGGLWDSVICQTPGSSTSRGAGRQDMERTPKSVTWRSSRSSSPGLDGTIVHHVLGCGEEGERDHMCDSVGHSDAVMTQVGTWVGESWLKAIPKHDLN